MENIYKEGDEVYAKVNPSEKLIVRRYVGRIYYCKVAVDTSLEEQVYFERELTNTQNREVKPST